MECFVVALCMHLPAQVPNSWCNSLRSRVSLESVYKL